jgi:hypothetical protein
VLFASFQLRCAPLRRGTPFLTELKYCGARLMPPMVPLCDGALRHGATLNGRAAVAAYWQVESRFGARLVTRASGSPSAMRAGVSARGEAACCGLTSPWRRACSAGARSPSGDDAAVAPAVIFVAARAGRYDKKARRAGEQRRNHTGRGSGGVKAAKNVGSNVTVAISGRPLQSVESANAGRLLCLGLGSPGTRGKGVSER